MSLVYNDPATVMREGQRIDETETNSVHSRIDRFPRLPFSVYVLRARVAPERPGLQWRETNVPFSKPFIEIAQLQVLIKWDDGGSSSLRLGSENLGVVAPAAAPHCAPLNGHAAESRNGDDRAFSGVTVASSNEPN